MDIDSSVKQVVVVLTDEPISKQDLAVKTGTVCVKASDMARVTNPKTWNKWMNGGYMKIVLKTGSKNDFLDILGKIGDEGFPFASEPRIVCIGPAPSIKIDTITKNLKLL